MRALIGFLGLLAGCGGGAFGVGVDDAPNNNDAQGTGDGPTACNSCVSICSSETPSCGSSAWDSFDGGDSFVCPLSSDSESSLTPSPAALRARLRLTM